MALDWSGQTAKLNEVFKAYSVGKSPQLEGRDWTRMLKSAGLLGRELTAGEADIIFSTAKPTSSVRLDFAAFQDALSLAATRLNMSPEEVALKLVIPETPKQKDASKLTGPERFFYDKTTYTGAKSEKAQSQQDNPQVTLSGLMDRSPYDLRGRKIEQTKRGK